MAGAGPVRASAAPAEAEAAPATSSRESRRIRASLKVSRPSDPAEREAESTARRIVAMPPPLRLMPVAEKQPLQAALVPVVPVPRPAAPAGAAAPPPRATPPDETSPELAAAVKSELGGGRPLPPDVAAFMAPRFKADFSAVRIHTGGKAANLATRLGARAFTFGRDIFFNSGQFDHKSPAGMELIAHELTHTIQQREVVQREAEAAPPAVAERTAPQVQRGIVSEALDWFADKANYIPGFRLFTVIIGVNPINQARVERSGANILRGLVELIPGGGLIVDALEGYGIFEKAGSWIEAQFRTLGMVGSMFRDALMQFIDTLSWRDVFRLGDVWNRAKRIFTEPIDRLISFGKGLVTGILKFIREAILKPLAALAEGTRGYPLLKAVLGEDPVTGEKVPQTADALIGGFMTLIGQQEIWENIKKANAIPRAWTWFKSALSGLMGLVRSIPTRFMDTLKSLEIMDLVLPWKAFIKVGKAFAGFIGDFLSWGLNSVLSLLQIIFEVVAPAAVPYLKKAASAFTSIIKNPIGFIKTLVAAGKKGFSQFRAGFIGHLQKSIVDWLTGTLEGIYIPKALTPMEMVKFVLSGLGLTWTNIRVKLVRATNETVVRALETGFDLVKTLVTQGPAAAWQQIVEGITNLKDMVIEQIKEFVKSKVVEIAVTKLLSMLTPAGAFIQAILAIYNTIMFFIERLKQIAQVAASFIDSIAAIAAGTIDPAANRVEKTMAGLLTLVISFLARFAGLGKVSDAVKRLIDRVRAPIDRALDRVVAWIVNQARRLGKAVVAGAQSAFQWWKAKLGFTNKDGERHTLQFIGSGPTATLGIATSLKTIRSYLDTHPDKTSSDSQARAHWATANKVFEDSSKVIFGFAKKTAAEAEIRKGIADNLAKISAAFAKLSGAGPSDDDYGANTPPVYGNPATVEVIHTNPLSGSPARPWPQTGIWKQIQDKGLTTIVDSWVQMHIIADNLGGSGATDANLIPAPNSVNRGPFYAWENKTIALAKAKTGTTKNRIWVSVSVGGSKTAPTSISGKSGLYLWKGKKTSPTWMKMPTPSLSVSVGVPKPNLTGTRKFSLNFTSRKVMIKEFTLSAQVAEYIYRGRPYSSKADWAKKMLAAGATTGQIEAVNSRSPSLNE